MQEFKAFLQRFNFSEKESVVYLTLLQDGSMGIAQLSKATDIHRPALPKIIASLEASGLVTEVHKGARILYEAVSPYVFVDKAKELLSESKHILPTMLAALQGDGGNTITVFHGEEGLATCFLDIAVSLVKGDTFYQINSSKDQSYVDSVVPETYRPLRDAKQLERRTITTRYVGTFKKPRLERSIRYIEESDEVFEHNVIQFIYGDKISLLDFNTLTGTIIQNKAIAEFQRSVFLTLYKRLQQ
jgi:DNA-binding MarR family transcriptional regulator